MEKGKISGTQLTILIIGFVLGSSIILTPGGRAEQLGWLAILLGLAEGALIALVYTALALRFPGLTLVEIAELVYGRFAGKLIGAGFLLFFLHLGALVGRNFEDFIKLDILPHTPAPVLSIIIALSVGYTVRNGVEVVARVEVLVLLSIATFILYSGLSLPMLQPENFLPFLGVPVGKFIFAAHGAASFPFGETFVFLMIIPFLNKPGVSRRSVLAGLAIGGFILILASARNIGVLGEAARLYLYPSYQSVRLINIGEVLTRVEIILAMNFMIFGFIKLTVLTYGASLALAQLFGLSSYRSLALPLIVLMMVYSLVIFPSVLENLRFADDVYPLYAPFFEFVIPLITLVLARLRGLPRGGG